MLASERVSYYRQRATEALAKAEALTDPEARRMMLTVAEMWETLASLAERTPAKGPKGDRE
jgi:hypothetical protein